jgi:hypothetical protein
MGALNTSKRRCAIGYESIAAAVPWGRPASEASGITRTSDLAEYPDWEEWFRASVADSTD